MSIDGPQFDRTVNGIAERIAFQLGDAEPGDEFQSFDERWVLARIYDTFKWLQGRRPSLFAQEIRFPLQPGSSQIVPEACDKLIDVLMVHREGRTFPVFEAPVETLRQAQLYDKLQCAPDFGIYHYAMSANDERAFTVSPPVTAGKKAEITGTCSDMERFFDDPDKRIDCDAAKWINTVVEYVLYQAFSMDGENQVSSSMSEQHRATFFDLAPVQRREAAS